jgi:hypothetical protein
MNTNQNNRTKIWIIRNSIQDNLLRLNQVSYENNHLVMQLIYSYDTYVKNELINESEKIKFQQMTISKINLIDPYFFRSYNFSINFKEPFTSLDHITYYEQHPMDYGDKYSWHFDFSEWLNLYVKANTLEIAYKDFEKQPNIIAFGHHKIGWNEYVFKVGENFRVVVNSNFGFGLSSYFSMTLYLKNIPIVSGNYIIYYRRHLSVEKLKNTTLFGLSDGENSWKSCFIYVCNIVNQFNKTGSTGFLIEKIRDSINRWIKGLHHFLNNSEFNLLEEVNEVNSFIGFKSTHLFDDDKASEIFPNRFPSLKKHKFTDFELYEFRNIRVTLSLDLLNNVKQLSEFFDTNSFINDLLTIARSMLNQNNQYANTLKIIINMLLHDFSIIEIAYQNELQKIQNTNIYRKIQAISHFKKFVNDTKAILMVHYKLAYKEHYLVEGWDRVNKKPSGLLKLETMDRILTETDWQNHFQSYGLWLKELIVDVDLKSLLSFEINRNVDHTSFSSINDETLTSKINSLNIEFLNYFRIIFDKSFKDALELKKEFLTHFSSKPYETIAPNKLPFPRVRHELNVMYECFTKALFSQNTRYNLLLNQYNLEWANFIKLEENKKSIILEREKYDGYLSKIKDWSKKYQTYI